MKRAYVQTSRARAAEETGQRILAAAYARLMDSYFDDVTLDQIAKDADVTVQTVIRRFGSKDGIVEALVALITPVIEEGRREAPVGDLAGIVANLVAHYENDGDGAMHLLRQERRVPAFAVATTHGKQWHAQWCEQVFAPWLDGRTGVDRRRLLAVLVTVCDVYSWYLLRRQRGLSRRQTSLALEEMLNGVLS